METSRGKKTKKNGWHLSLGLKETIFAGIGVVGLMMMSFALGALAGRGDIYRVASNWGLMSPEASRVAQWTPLGAVTGGPPVTAPAPAAPAGTETATTPVPSLTVAAAPAAAPESKAPLTAPPPIQAAAPAPAPVPVAAPVPMAAAKPAHPAPVTASIATVPPLPAAAPASTAKKKGKTGGAHHDAKAKEEELQRLRREVAQKLKFQNSFDTGPKAKLPKSKEHDKAKGGKSQPALVKVGQYKTSKEAQAKAAELQKKGIKATVQKSKNVYLVCKPGSAAHPDAEKLAKKEKVSTPPKKPAE